MTNLRFGPLLLLLFVAPCLTAYVVAGCRTKVVVSVLDRSRTPVRGLSAQNFRATFHGRPASILSSQYSESPRRVAIVLDASSSVTEDKLSWDMARTLAVNIALAPGIRAGLVVFATSVVETLDFSHSGHEIVERIKQLSIPSVRWKDRQTALRDSILQAADLFGTPEVGDSVYIVSDGGDNRSQASRANVEQQLSNRGLRAFAYILKNRAALNDEERPGEYELRQLAEVTGGTSQGSFGPAQKDPETQLQHDLAKLSDQMVKFYQLEVALPEGYDKGIWKVEVVNAEGIKMKHIFIRSVHEFAACSKGKDEGK